MSHTVFDHTSIIKTILLRFCPQALDGPQAVHAGRARPGPQYPGTQVAQASHLGGLPTRATPRAAPPRDALVHQATAKTAQPRAGHPAIGRPGSGEPPLNDLQQRILTATDELARRGHPSGTP